MENSEKLYDAKAHPLDGSHNGRLDEKEKRDNEAGAAWAQTAYRTAQAHVSVPGERGALHAKEWVDNGSRL